MTDAGRCVLPPLGPRSFRVDEDIVRALKQARLWTAFKATPPLYQRVRVDNIQRVKASPEEYEKRLNQLMVKTREGVLYGAWDDYGRLA